jgi:hypothetical protein
MCHVNRHGWTVKSVSFQENIRLILLRDLATELYSLKTALCSGNRITSVYFLRKANHKIRDSVCLIKVMVIVIRAYY